MASFCSPMLVTRTDLALTTWALATMAMLVPSVSVASAPACPDQHFWSASLRSCVRCARCATDDDVRVACGVSTDTHCESASVRFPRKSPTQQVRDRVNSQDRNQFLEQLKQESSSALLDSAPSRSSQEEVDGRVRLFAQEAQMGGQRSVPQDLHSMERQLLLLQLDGDSSTEPSSSEAVAVTTEEGEVEEEEVVGKRRLFGPDDPDSLAARAEQEQTELFGDVVRRKTEDEQEQEPQQDDFGLLHTILFHAKKKNSTSSVLGMGVIGDLGVASDGALVTALVVLVAVSVAAASALVFRRWATSRAGRASFKMLDDGGGLLSPQSSFRASQLSSPTATTSSSHSASASDPSHAGSEPPRLFLSLVDERGRTHLGGAVARELPV